MVEKNKIKTLKNMCMVKGCNTEAYLWYFDAEMWLCKKHYDEYVEADYKYD